jgi:hypothetical protein
MGTRISCLAVAASTADRARVGSAMIRATEPTTNRPTRRGRRAGERLDIRLPPVGDWRTTDQDEINRRRLRARDALSALFCPLWGEALERLGEFVERPGTPVIPTIDALEAARLRSGTVPAGAGGPAPA